MKTFDLGHNPENLPLAPGYRWLSKDEPHRVGDEIWATGDRASGQNGPLQWCALTNSGSWTVTQPNALWSYRRALCVDDLFAPPPDQWKEGYEMLARPDRGPNVEYWSRDLKSWRHCVTVECEYLPEYYYRRPIGLIQIVNQAIDEARTAPLVLKPGQSIVVRVGDSQALSRAVQEIAFAAGWKRNLASGYAKPDQPYTLCHPFDAIHLSAGREITLACELHHRACGPAALFLDARTDMGKLIDLLTPAKKVPVGPMINGHVGIYTKGAKVIVFGCASICIATLNHVIGSQEGTRGFYHGNRLIHSITLGRSTTEPTVTMTYDQIKAILSYVDEVNALP